MREKIPKKRNFLRNRLNKWSLETKISIDKWCVYGERCTVKKNENWCWMTWFDSGRKQSADGIVKVMLFKALATGGIFPGIFLGISVEMVLAGLREGYILRFTFYALCGNPQITFLISSVFRLELFFFVPGGSHPNHPPPHKTTLPSPTAP